MLSILIPVYNYDVRGLVSDLLSQILLISDPVEICLLDDGSDSQWSSSLNELAALDKVSLFSFTSNQGRVASRNKLAEIARYDYLLFIDCDAEVVSSNYITNYLNRISDSVDMQVIAGGHIYQEEVPGQKYLLHWRYGHEVEVRSAAERDLQPYNSFSTFNFCIEKLLYLEYLTDIEVEGYGHEDTLMGDVMGSYVFGMEHIDNPLLHAGLKPTDQFLSDMQSAVENAERIQEKIPNIKIKVIRIARIIKLMGMSNFVIRLLNILNKRIDLNLYSSNPRLIYLQLYKLKILLELQKKND